MVDRAFVGIAVDDDVDIGGDLGGVGEHSGEYNGELHRGVSFVGGGFFDQSADDGVGDVDHGLRGLDISSGRDRQERIVMVRV